MRKYGPQAFGAAPTWLTPSSASISPDRDAAAGVVRDPFAPMLLAAAMPVGASPIPTLSEWGLVLMSLLAAAFGMRSLRRKNSQAIGY
ncbi:IPTL-CTERM sorting domain-containing protein [Acidovorax sp. SUPP3334]|uniref:IPTL-CTERM sorting domain-containing protein n=1 Tax=Acidovorax sp. SUPP3334 TaxID=2920881 RepID=UPI0023DE2595|nr:IPTL-CTERM sorting domain-containing protein [Acidovorax sp. SUPP3334]GKT23503.1 hypothetical protein AVHM3334_11835 [Acidovorax sp. SUPP3334]